MTKEHYEERIVELPCGHVRAGYVRMPVPEVVDAELSQVIERLVDENFDRLRDRPCGCEGTLK